MALPDPITRKEMYLNKAATGSGSVPPEPVTREEMYLAEIANGGGGGGASSLADLSDVSIAAPQPDQALAYNAETRKWENKAPVGAVLFPVNDTETIAAINNVVSLLKSNAKSNGSSGVKIPYDGLTLVGNVLGGANRRLVPLLAIGNSNSIDLYLFTGGSTTGLFASFAADHADSDGLYRITFTFGETYAMIAATYVACPAMS
jgi:hypothetical protein